jgi:hypothetical protein
MAAELVGAVLRLKGLTPAEKVILGLLGWHCNGKTLRCDPSIATLAEEADMNRRYVLRLLDVLVEKGLLIRHIGHGRGHRNHYSFPPTILSRGQAGLWPEKVAPRPPLKQEAGQINGGLLAQEKVAYRPKKGGPLATNRKGKERELTGSIPYGRLDAAAGYRQALADLPQDENRQRQVAVLINYCRAHCPKAAVPGQLAGMVKVYPAGDVLAEIWRAIPMDDPLGSARAALKTKAARAGAYSPPPADQAAIDAADAAWVASSRQGRGHEEGEV